MYGSFAKVYDTFMDTVPYEEWCGEICRILRETGIDDGLVLDLGCGTGSMTRLLSRAGYDMIGVDASPAMLQIAREKDGWSEKEQERILYLLQDMREFERYGTVRAAVSVCDSLNYLQDEEELLETFRLVNNYLDPGGIFLFDMNTLYKYREVLGDRTFAEAREECSFIWENTWFEEERENEYDLTLFVQTKEGLYRRYEEIHYQKGFEAGRVIALLKKAGLEPLWIREAYTGGDPLWEGAAGAEEPWQEPMCERLLFAARECMKKRT